jgi:hypothetical protein
VVLYSNDANKNLLCSCQFFPFVICLRVIAHDLSFNTLFTCS